MPQFTPGEEGVAIATFPTKPAGLECTAELWLASDMTKVATSGGIPFTATGEDQSISFPITLPGVEGTYPVYLYVFSNRQRIAAFLGDEEVVITGLPTVPLDGGWTCSDVSYSYVGSYPPAPAWRLFRYTCLITSKASITITKAIAFRRRGYLGDETISDWIQPGVLYDGTYYGVPNPRQITLAPGGVYTYIANYAEGSGYQIQCGLIDELGNISGLTGWISL